LNLPQRNETLWSDHFKIP